MQAGERGTRVQGEQQGRGNREREGQKGGGATCEEERYKKGSAKRGSKKKGQKKINKG